MAKNIDQMSPEQIRARGRELLQLAARKERELRNRRLLKIGEIFQREIAAGWPATWEQLAEELEAILRKKIKFPAWGFVAGVQGGGSAPLEEVKNDQGN